MKLFRFLVVWPNGHDDITTITTTAAAAEYSSYKIRVR